MWKKLLGTGTIAVALFAGTAFAVASQATPDTRMISDDVQGDHWSEMSAQMGYEWPEMVGHMGSVHGDRFPDMVNLMQSSDHDMGSLMDGSGMDRFDMDSLMGVSDMDGRWGAMHG